MFITASTSPELEPQWLNNNHFHAEGRRKFLMHKWLFPECRPPGGAGFPMESLWNPGPIPRSHILPTRNGRKRPPSGSTPPAFRVESHFAAFHRPGFCNAESSLGQVPDNHWIFFNPRLNCPPRKLEDRTRPIVIELFGRLTWGWRHEVLRNTSRGEALPPELALVRVTPRVSGDSQN